MLYDGSREAKFILMAAEEEAEGTSAKGAVRHALEYVKGRDVPNIGMFTLDLIDWPDRCVVCKGEEGGVLGNENLINGHPVCDYCHAKMLSGLIDPPAYDENGVLNYDKVEAPVPETPKELVQIAPANYDYDVSTDEPKTAS